MNTKHGVWVNAHDIQLLTFTALQHGYTHVWVFADAPEIPASHGEWSIQANERHGKVATVSVWKRGSGHVSLIYVKNTAWVEGAEAFKDITPAQLLDTVNTLERELGVTIGGSPASAGWALLKKLHPEWIENIPVDLREMHFTPKAGSDLIWQNKIKPVLNFKYIHKFDKRSAYPAAASDTDVGVGVPVHLEGEDARIAASHEKGHPQEVGVWRCSILYRPGVYSADMPPIWKEEKGTYAGSEDQWLSGPIIRLLRAVGHEVTVHEGYVFPQRHDVLVQWANVLWQKRSQSTNERVQKAYKQIANSTIGFTAFKGFEEDEDEKRRPDIRLQVVSRNAEIMTHNIRKIKELYGATPCMVYMDAVYYLSNEPYLEFPYFKQREQKLGGFKYEGSIALTPDVQAMFARKMSVAERLVILNKIGWKK